MNGWPDQEQTLLHRYVRGLRLQDVWSRRPYESILRRFQRFVESSSHVLSQEVFGAWLHQGIAVASLRMVVRRAQILEGFLAWLVQRGHLQASPLAELKNTYACRSTAAIVRALVSADPTAALDALRPQPRFGSHLGPAIRAHVDRMRTLGYRYEPSRFLRFDRFLQARPGAETQSLTVLVKEYARKGGSPNEQVRRLTVGRVLAESLRRGDPSIVPVALNRFLVREAKRRCRAPYIFSSAKLQQLFAAARAFPSPNAPLRPLTLYTMLVLGYCAGLRIGELVRLRVGDVRVEEGSIDILETKFFKSRRLPLQPTVMAVVRDYLKARKRAGMPDQPEARLFGYAYVTAGQLLHRVMKQAGLKPASGRAGPRVHDLRHSFVVHRMLAWYHEGINPRSRLPYLATYLGHRDIHSTLVYLTITQELLREASARFRTFGVHALNGKGEEVQ